MSAQNRRKVKNNADNCRKSFELWTVTTLLLIGLLGTTIMAVSIGTVRIAPTKIASILAQTVFGFPEGNWEPWESVILLKVRLPRVVAGLLVGGALALCGAVMQGIFRNPMADPGVIGVSAGAAMGAVAAIHLCLAAHTVLAVPLLAFAGAVSCAFLVYTIATNRGRTSVTSLLLAGVAVASVATSVASFLLYLSLAEYEVGRQIMRWLMGGLDARTWIHIRMSAPIILGGSAILIFYGRDLNVMVTGEDAALTLGINVPKLRRNLLLVSSAVTAAAVAICGSIAFVGLVVPHIVRMIIRPNL